MRRYFGVAVATGAALALLAPLAPVAASASRSHPHPGHPQLIVTCSPNPVVETATSNVAVVCQVEGWPKFSGSTVSFTSTQLTSHCLGPTPLGPGTTSGVVYETLLNASPLHPAESANATTVPLDNDGNATVVVTGVNCSPGTALLVADLNAPPFATAVTRLVVRPPQVTPAGIHGFPVNEVETGDGGAGMGAFGASDVYAVFYIETNPVFAEQTVLIGSNELTARCGLGYRWETSSGALATGFAGPPSANGPFPRSVTDVVVSNPGPTGGIDNDGNAVFIFKGSSCAAGRSTVIAEILNNGPTYGTLYVILPPAITI
jgi:hypothetical protein